MNETSDHCPDWESRNNEVMERSRDAMHAHYRELEALRRMAQEAVN